MTARAYDPDALDRRDPALLARLLTEVGADQVLEDQKGEPSATPRSMMLATLGWALALEGGTQRVR